MSAAIDQYTLCPGGTGKKVRFCCPELLPELQRIQRMMDGQQWHASVEHIERIQRNHPDRACLFALKGRALFELSRSEPLRANAEAFVARHPDNPLAQAELACALAAEGVDGGRAAIRPILKALAACGDKEVHERIERHVFQVIDRMLMSGFAHAARAILKAWGDDEALFRFDRGLPEALWYKEPRPLVPCPVDFVWKNEFEEAFQQAQTLRWFEAERGFAELAQRANGVPAVWHNLMVVRSWLGDMAGSAEGARQCASLAPSDDDAAELEAYAAYSTGEMLGDTIRIPDVLYPVTDAEALRAALERDAAITPLEVIPNPMVKEAEERAKSKKWYRLVGPPVPPAEVPEWACVLTLAKGKENEPPHLTVMALTPESLPDMQRRVESIGGDLLGPSRLADAEPEESATVAFLRHEGLLGMGAPSRWHPVLAERRLEFLRQRWPKMPLGLLGGKSFEEGLADGALRRRALAALLLLEHHLRRFGMEVGGEAVRELVGLAPREPIDPAVIPPESVPLARLHLVDAEKLSGPQLAAAFERARRFSATAAMARLAPGLAQDDTVPWSIARIEAAQVFLQQEPNYARALALCQKWRQETSKIPGSCAIFDILEVEARLQRGELREAVELLNHMTAEHGKQPGVAQFVNNFREIVDVYIAVSRARQAVEPSIVAPDGGEPGKLWTPDSAREPGPKPTLWTPGNP